MKNLLSLITLGSIFLTSTGFYRAPGSQQQGNDFPPNNASYDQQGNQVYYPQNNPYNQQQRYYQQSNQPYYPQQGYYRQSNQPYYQQQGYYPQNPEPYYQQQSSMMENGSEGYDQDQGSENTGPLAYQDQQNQLSKSDQEILKKIDYALSPGWFTKGYPDVGVEVYNSDVNLTGTVETNEDKNKVEDIAKNTTGVRKVYNQINVVKANVKKS